jgi:hypothetical protein
MILLGANLSPTDRKTRTKTFRKGAEIPLEKIDDKIDDSPVLVVKNGVFRFCRSESIEYEVPESTHQSGRRVKSISGFKFLELIFPFVADRFLRLLDRLASENPPMAYVSQTGFILNATVRANFVFSRHLL